MMEKGKESGQSILVIAFIVMILLALVAVVVDVGNAYAHRRIVQNAVDAAALAGARQLAEREVLENSNEIRHLHVYNQVQTYLGANGLPALEEGTWDAYFVDGDGDRLEQVRPRRDYIGADVEGVEVVGHLPFDTYFAHLLGFPELTASTDATAWVLTGPCSGDNLFPIALSEPTLDEEPEDGNYIIWDKSNHLDPMPPGNFGWLHWGDRGLGKQGPSNNTLVDNINDTSRSGFWGIGDQVPGSTGVQFSSGAREALMARILGLDPDNRPTTVVIPVFDQVTGTGSNARYTISGFAAFELTCYHHSKNHEVGTCHDSQTNDKYIEGHFVGMVTPRMDDGCIDVGIVAPSFRKPK